MFDFVGKKKKNGQRGLRRKRGKERMEPCCYVSKGKQVQ